MINHECINQPYGRILKFSRVQAKEMLTADELKENFAKNGRDTGAVGKRERL